LFRCVVSEQLSKPVTAYFGERRSCHFPVFLPVVTVRSNYVWAKNGKSTIFILWFPEEIPVVVNLLPNDKERTMGDKKMNLDNCWVADRNRRWSDERELNGMSYSELFSTNPYSRAKVEPRTLIPYEKISIK
jgi:hypothetical protein